MNSDDIMEIMSTSERQKRLVNSISRSMEAEGFNFAAVKKTLKKQLQRASKA